MGAGLRRVAGTKRVSAAAPPPWLDAPLARGLASRAHALLVHAPGALGQFELALALARGWLCESPQEGRACGRCASCRLLDAHSHPDLHLLLPEALRAGLGWGAAEGEGGDDGEARSKAKPSREIRIDALRAAIEWGQKTSARGGAKLLLIHPADAMNAVTANALLKTLEEPPGRLRLVLTTTDPEALLPTVRSRCQRLAIAPPSPEQARAWLQAHEVAQPEVLLAAAGGQPQAALALDAEGIGAAAWAALPGAVRRGHLAALAAWPVPRVVEALHKLCHDLLVQRAGGAPRFFGAEALAPALQPAAPPLPALLAWQRELLAAARHEDHPWHAPLRIEALLAQAAALWQTARPPRPGRGPSVDTLPDR
jgi:DNA polymerase-3 subunit delta'